MSIFSSKMFSLSTIAIVGFLCSTIVSASGWGSAHAASCVAERPYAGTATVVFDSNGSLVNFDQAQYAYVMCPIPDLSDKPANSFNWFGVYLESPLGFGVSARACAKYWGSSGHNCGGWTNSYAKGATTMTIDLSSWATNPWDFKYVEIALPPSSSGLSSSASKFYGYIYTY